MEREQVSEDSITVTELKGGGGGGAKGPVFDEGTYEAEYQRMKVFMDNTPWGEKKCARLYFKVTRGKYKDEQTSYKGTFFLDEDTGNWIVGSKSKFADAIRAITGGKTLSAEHAGTKVFVSVKQKVSKKTGNPYSFVDSIIPRPQEDEGVADEAEHQAQTVARPQAARPAPANVARTMPAAKPIAVAPRPAVKPVVPAPAADAGDGLLADLTELSDFKE